MEVAELNMMEGWGDLVRNRSRGRGGGIRVIRVSVVPGERTSMRQIENIWNLACPPFQLLYHG